MNDGEAACMLRERAPDRLLEEPDVSREDFVAYMRGVTTLVGKYATIMYRTLAAPSMLS